MLMFSVSCEGFFGEYFRVLFREKNCLIQVISTLALLSSLCAPS